MVTAISATLIKVGKEILKLLAGNEKGRKFLGYVVGIVLVIAFLPLIVVYGLFAWMGNNPESIIDHDMVYELMPPEYQAKMTEHDPTLREIEEVFTARGIGGEDILLAQSIFLTCLCDRAEDADFTEAYAACFQSVTETEYLLDAISEAFNITFTEGDRESFQQVIRSTSNKSRSTPHENERTDLQS